MLTYKSDFPNQVQQLNVSISQHYYLLKDETIRWQEKSLDINWKNFRKSNKRHLVTFIIRDHYSSCFYAELHSIDLLPSIEEFLYNAWTEKEDYEFCGIGHTVIVPKTTQVQFPQLLHFFGRTSKVNIQTPTTGFSSAVRSIREWERNIRYVQSFIPGIDILEGFQKDIDYINRHMNQGFGFDQDTNLAKWALNKPQLIMPGSRGTFYSYFKPVKL